MNLQPPSILLMGPSGTGKTYSLATLIEAGLDLFLISTEPHGVETLIDAVSVKKLPISKLHWRYLGPTRTGFETLQQMAESVSKLNQEFLSKQAPTSRSDASFIEVMKTFNNFVDDKDGKSYGPLNKLTASAVVVVDSLSGLSAMAMDNTIGDKVTANPGEWGIAMRLVDKFLLSCTSDLKSFFVLTAHPEIEADAVTGASKVMVSTLGKKLAPQLPRFFSEVVWTKAETKDSARQFLWRTNVHNTVLKNRSLSISDKLPPSFGPIVEAYRKRLDTVKQAS